MQDKQDQIKEETHILLFQAIQSIRKAELVWRRTGNTRQSHKIGSKEIIVWDLIEELGLPREEPPSKKDKEKLVND